jgi:hypothetical protein
LLRRQPDANLQIKEPVLGRQTGRRLRRPMEAIENGGAIFKLWNRYDSFRNEQQFVLVLSSQGAV